MKKSWLLLVLVLVLGVGLRLRNFSLGPVDAHAMRQTDTECVAYFMGKGEGSILHPKNCLIRPVSNTEGYFFLEFPAYEWILGSGYRFFGNHVEVLRVINLGLYVLTVISLFLFLRKWFGDEKIGIIASLLYSLAPASIFFLGHAIHPDVFAIAMMSLSLAILACKKNVWVSGILLGLSVATRPFGLICLPMYIGVLRRNKAKWFEYLMLGFLSIALYGFWRWWTLKSGFDATWENWVLYGQEKIFNFGYLKNLIFKNIVGEVMGKTISGLAVGGIILMVINKNRKLLPFILWLFLVPLYWYIAPDGNMIHQYYADIYIIPVVVLAAYLMAWLWDKQKIIFGLVTALVIYNGYHVSNYFFEDKVPARKLVMAKEISENIPEKAKILLLSKADPVTLSLSHRQGWMLGEWPTDVAPHIYAIMEMKNFKIDYLAEPKGSMDMKREDEVVVEENYPLFKETENLRILKWEKSKY